MDSTNPGDFKFPFWWLLRIYKTQDKVLGMLKVEYLIGDCSIKLGSQRTTPSINPQQKTVNKFPYVTGIVGLGKLSFENP